MKYRYMLMVLLAGCSAGSVAITSATLDATKSLREGETALEAKRFDEAIALIGKAIESNQLQREDPQLALELRARAFIAVGRHDDAIADLSKLIEIEPNPDFIALRGSAFLAKGDKASAKSDFTLARQKNPRIRLPVGA